VAWPLPCDSGRVREHLADTDLGRHEQWVDYCRQAKRALPLSEACNTTRAGHVSPYEFVLALSRLCTPRDVVIPCSSGGAFTGTMQSFEQKAGQRIVSNKGLASMGYGLSGAIGAALASPGRRTLLIAGDGGFIQNAQELGTARANELNLKIFLFDDGGYASIRMTQRNYFDGHYVACDRATGVGLPDWELLFRAYGIPALRLTPDFESDASFREAFEKEGVVGFVVPIDPEQTWYPKISSRVAEDGGMRSNPLHRMTPDLDPETLARLGRFLPSEDRS
jgi:acetolactate synthase I/II/III large subunit